MLIKFKAPFKSWQKILIFFPVLILFLISLILTLSPVIRYRSWEANLRWRHWIGFFVWLSAFLYLHRLIKKQFNRSKLLLFAAIQLAVGLGLLTIWRLNIFFGFKQTLWVLLCTAITAIVLHNSSYLSILKKYKYMLLISGLLLIMLTFIFGTYPGGNGPQLWLGFGGIYFQPSELLKIILILYLAAYFSEVNTTKINLLRDIFPTLFLAIASVVLVILQRDLGTALIIISIYILMLFSVYGKSRILLVSLLILAVFAIVGYYAIDLVRLRFQAWIFPWNDPLKGSYQIVQSIIAIAAGGIFGTGIGLGYPNLVPLSHSDFIFSAIAEEFGLVGTVGILVLEGIILFQGISIAQGTKSRFHRYLAIGIIGFLLSQSILIIGGNTRLLPITGVTLPYFSYGGSSLLVSYFSMAILVIIEGDNIKKVELEKPLKIIAAFFSVCLVSLSLVLGWWGLVHANEIQFRDDNARNLIANLFVKRGDILDRNGERLVQSIGIPGEIDRQYTYPPLSNTIGYYHQKFGTTGIEDSFNSYLSGRRGYPSQDIWFSYLLYDQPPEGRPIRLTIDTNLQKQADDLLEGCLGGLVILDAKNGELLAVSTSPYFDANLLDDHWQEWSKDENAPLINRATQGAYPVGGLLSPLLLAAEQEKTGSTESNTVITAYDKIDDYCTSEDVLKLPHLERIRFGCVSTTLNIGKSKKPNDYFSRLPLSLFFEQIEIGIATDYSASISDESDWLSLLLGDEKLRSNPLQIASAFQPFGNAGKFIYPNIISAVNTSSASWIVISDTEKREVITSEKTVEILENFNHPSEKNWSLSAATSDENGNYFWFVGGTINPDGNKSYIVAVALENASREDAIEIGSSLLETLGG